MSAQPSQPKQSKPVQAQTLYKRLQSQLDGSFFPAAIKTVDRLLRLNPADELAAQTRVQLLIALDRFPTALESSNTLAEGDVTLEQVYCLYKTGREKDALSKLDQVPVEVGESRAAKLLEAQINYRLERFEAARDLYEDLIATAEPDAPELIDLQTNLDACQSSLNFLSSLPATIANASIPPLDSLESQPIGPLLAKLNKPATSRPVASTSTLPAPAPTAAADATAKPPRGKLPKNYEAQKVKGKGPDPDRWLPYRERPGMAEIIVAKREKARGRNKELMQGGGAEEGAKGSKPAQGTGGKAGGGGGGKKKKGKK